MMSTPRYHIDAPVRFTRKWAAGLSVLLGIGIGAGATLGMGVLTKPAPPPPPVAVVSIKAPSIVAPAPPQCATVVDTGLDAAPWGVTLRANMAELNSSLEEMPTLKSLPYKAAFENIADKALVLSQSIGAFEQAILTHKNHVPAPDAGASPLHQPSKTK